ncbi:DUF4270 family protein [Algoriphagus sp. H41]|uniref:DUF4270 family protein n=1 Tax=Algoriphagus oliviformis TaxID=2811231 RepID=A0ABS3C7Q6_9BACT|nr:DUF4270 family protein [Algoriphagus oliviformis]MBN7812865.1 DUF4270 family protein [Algoriphagus oliviformis]
MRIQSLGILLLCLLTSCFENSYLEEIPEVDLEDDFSIRKIVHSELELGTVFLDSLVTSGKTSMLLGSYADPVRGHIEASPYFEFAPESFAAIDESRELDSLVLVLKYSSTRYDTLQSFRLKINEIDEAFDYANEDEVFYHFESLQTKPIATAEVQVYPVWDSVRVTLPMEFGRELFGKLKGAQSILSSIDDFRDAFHGLNLEVEGSSPLIELSTDTYLLFYYQEKNETNRYSEEMKISVSSSLYSSKTFTHLEMNRDATPFANRETKTWIPAEETGDMALADELGLSAIGLKLGSLTSIGEIPSGYYVAEAKLVLPVKRLTYDGSLNPVAESLDIYIQRKIGLLDGYLSQASLYSLDNEFQENTYFLLDATSYVDDKIRGGEPDSYLWMELMAGEALNTGYLALGTNSSTQKPRLEIILIPLN